MTTIPQLCTGSCVKILYTTKGSTYERGNKNNRDRKAFIPVLQILCECRYFHPQEDRTDQIQKEDSKLEIVTARYQQPTSNSSIKNIQPSPSSSAAKRQVIALAIEKRLQKQRPLQQCGTNKDGPTKRWGRIKGAKQEQPRRAKQQQIMQE